MAEFQEVLRQKKRYCKGRLCGKCDLNPSESLFTGCAVFTVANPAKAERIIMKWAAEHPEPKLKTMAQVFFEKFPDAPRNCAGDAPNACPGYIWDGERTKYFMVCNNQCAPCWNRPAPDEYQEGAERDG